jgi:hypothetical protein
MTIHKYALLKDDTVLMVLSYDDENEKFAGIVSGIDSGAILVEVDETNPADQFWTWDGNVAISPTGETWTGADNA